MDMAEQGYVVTSRAKCRGCIDRMRILGEWVVGEVILIHDQNETIIKKIGQGRPTLHKASDVGSAVLGQLNHFESELELGRRADFIARRAGGRRYHPRGGGQVRIGG